MTKSKLVSVVFGAFAALLLLIGVAEAYEGVSPDVEVATSDEAVGRKICIYRNGHKYCYWRPRFQETEGVDQAALEREDGEEEFTFEAVEVGFLKPVEDSSSPPLHTFAGKAPFDTADRD